MQPWLAVAFTSITLVYAQLEDRYRYVDYSTYGKFWDLSLSREGMSSLV
jgi:hypothetical protein